MVGACGFLRWPIARTHTEINTIGGVCRHLSLCTLGKHLGLIQDAPKGIGASKPKSPIMRLGKHGQVVFTEQHGRLDALVASFRRRQAMIRIKIKNAEKDQDLSAVMQAYEELVFHPSVPHEMAWGRRSGVYHGEHIVRKLVLLHYHSGDVEWQWGSRAAIVSFGPDKCEYLKTVPKEWKEAKIRRVFYPLDLTRLSMWACLVGLAFKRKPAVKAACEAHQITAAMIESSAQELRKNAGDNPHVEDVLEHALAVPAVSG